MQDRQQMNIVIVGHVDHGKSRIIGRMLADTNSLPDGKLEQVKRNCEINSKPFEYAFLLDALKDEQSQGITIDSARVFFKTDKRDYIIIDAPGHIEFLKNMITGAARAESALLVIDAQEGVRENSRRHGYMLAMLGISQVVVLINKMDLVDYDQKIFNEIVEEYTEFLKDIKIEPACFIPVSGMKGDNVASLSPKMDWYNNDTVLQVLDQFKKEPEPIDKPLRMPVQDVYKFTKFDDDRRIIAGNVETGSLKVGDKIVFYPSGKKSRVSSLEGFNEKKKDRITPGYATGFTMDEQVYVKRGEMVVKADEEKPEVTTRIKVSIFWLGRKPLEKKKDYILKLGTTRTNFRLEEITRVINSSDLSADEEKERIERHEVAECILKLSKAIAFDLAEKLAVTSRFVIIDEYEIRGGGIVREALKDQQSWIRDKVFLRNYNWIKSDILPIKRAEKLNQRSTLILITGAPNSGRKEIAKKLENRFFQEGKFVYYLGLGSVLYGVDADIKRDADKKKEHMRRFAEVAHILLDSGLILIATARLLEQKDLEIIKTAVHPDSIETVWVGEEELTDIAYDIKIDSNINKDEALIHIKEYLQEKGIIFKVW